MISGKNMDGFVCLVRQSTGWCRLSPDSVHTCSSLLASRFKSVVLPGFYRPTKSWDALVAGMTDSPTVPT
ncbi:MAG TPA: hypothetical protein ENJ18_13795 [Nannocystis exedens]|nr:hypothetical protein [Nannocystis exedens]